MFLEIGMPIYLITPARKTIDSGDSGTIDNCKHSIEDSIDDTENHTAFIFRSISPSKTLKQLSNIYCADKITSRVLNQAAPTNGNSLTKLFNFSVKTNTHLSEWKIAGVTLIIREVLITCLTINMPFQFSNC